MSTPVPAADDNQFLGYCELWNGYFIGTSLGSLLMIALICYLSYRRDKSHTPGVIDWGLPWGIGCFLFQIGLWNLAPPNVLFILFKEAVPTLPMAERMACLQVENVPIITSFFILLGLQVVFLYSHDSMVKAIAADACDDSDLLREALRSDSRADPTAVDRNLKVLVVGTVQRGRILWERAKRRAEWRGANGQGTYVAYSSSIMFPFVGYHTQAGFVHNNLETLGADAADYQLIFTQRVTRENVYRIPLEGNSVDKVVMCPFFRNGPPIGSFTTSEDSKAHRMAMVVREVLRVLKPGGRIVWVDAGSSILPGYCDMRDALGEQHVQLEFPEGRKVQISPLMGLPLGRAVATKPLDWVPSPRSPKSPSSPTPKQIQGTVVENEETLIGITDDEEVDDGKEKLSDSTVMGIMMPIQAALFIGLCFLGAGLFEPLNYPTSVPVSERIGNLFPNLATSYPAMAYMEREYVINSAHFTSVPSLLCHMAKTTPLALLATVLLTAVFQLPKLAFQVGLASTTLSSTVRAVIGYSVSILLGIIMYQVGNYRRKTAFIKSKGLDATYRKYL